MAERVPRPFSLNGGDAVFGTTGLDPSEARYARNFYPGGQEVGRRRRGFRIIRAVSAATIAPLDGIEYTLTATWRFYKQNTSLYQDDGTTLTVVSTGWNAPFPNSYFGLPNALVDALVAYNANKRRVLREPAGTVIEENFDLAAPGTTGVTVASSATAGSLVAGNTHQVYIVHYNANTGRQSGPIGPYTVTIAAGQSSYDINTMPPAPADTQFTHFKIYRTQAGLTVPFLSQTVVIATAGTLVNDGIADANLILSDPLPVSAYGDFFVGVPPGASNTRFGLVYKGMILHFTYKGKMYFTEPGSNHRWSANYRFDFPISGYDCTAACEGDEGLVVTTGREVFLGTGTGVYSGNPPVSDWRFKKISDEFGAFNSKCLLAVGGQVYGLGPGGIFTVDAGGVRPVKKVVRSNRTRTVDIYWSATTNGGNVPSLGYDPIQRNLWATIPLQETSNSVQAPKMVTAILPIDETGKIGWFDHSVTCFFKGGGRRSFGVGGSDHGRAMIGADSYGNVIELEYGEYDGKLVANPTSFVVDTVVGGSPTLLATITAVGMGPAHLPERGVRVVGFPADYTKDPVVGTVTANDTVDDFTIADWGAAAVTGTTFYIGGILGWYETGALLFTPGDDGGIADRAMNAVNLYLHDLVYEEADILGSGNHAHIIAQLKVDGGNWGPYVTVYDGTAYPDPGKTAANLTGKVEASGKSKGGTTFRIRFFNVMANRPARPFAYEPAVSEAWRPAKAGS